MFESRVDVISGGVGLIDIEAPRGQEAVSLAFKVSHMSI